MRAGVVSARHRRCVAGARAARLILLVDFRLRGFDDPDPRPHENDEREAAR